MTVSKDDILKNIDRRILMLTSLKIAGFSVIAGRLYYLQKTLNQKYQFLSDKNRINLQLIPAVRGSILDNKNRILAISVEKFALFFDQKRSKLTEQHFIYLAKIFPNRSFDIANIKKLLIKYPSHQAVKIADFINWHEITKFEQHVHYLPGFFIEINGYRNYPLANSIAHLVGYVKKGDSQEEDYNKQLVDVYKGLAGIEHKYNHHLSGEVGFRKIEVNARGNYIRELETVAAKKGANIQLTIDSDLQEYVASKLPNQGSCAVILNCKNGEILSLVSKPDYDPNIFTKAIEEEIWQKLIDNNNHPLVNRTTSFRYPPGSLFKIVTLLAALNYGIKPSFTVNCKAKSANKNSRFNCWKRAGHGQVDMHKALPYSCNNYFYELAKKIGVENIYNTAKLLGLDTITNIDLNGEIRNILPDKEWKRQNLKSDWYVGDSFNYAIGQGFVATTPIALAQLYMIIANNGSYYPPHLNKNNSEAAKQININNNYLQFIQKALFNVVNMPYGTAFRNRIQNHNFKLAGKTGTSQVRSKKTHTENLSSQQIKRSERNHSLFAGYAPFNDAKYVAVVIAEHMGAGNAVAAPLAKDFLEFCYKNKI